MFRIAYYPKTT